MTMTKKADEMDRAGSKKLPFIYRSIFNFWLAFILPTGLVMMVVTGLYFDGTIQFELLRNISTWGSCLAFQLIFGFLMYIWVYLPAVKGYKKD